MWVQVGFRVRLLPMVHLEGSGMMAVFWVRVHVLSVMERVPRMVRLRATVNISLRDAFSQSRGVAFSLSPFFYPLLLLSPFTAQAKQPEGGQGRKSFPGHGYRWPHRPYHSEPRWYCNGDKHGPDAAQNPSPLLRRLVLRLLADKATGCNSSCPIPASASVCSFVPSLFLVATILRRRGRGGGRHRRPRGEKLCTSSLI